MNLSKTKRFVSHHSTTIEAAVFFVVYYLSVWLVIRPELIYYMSGRMFHYYPFVMDYKFFYESLTTVGGPISYLTGFLAQCFYVSWIGALILTILAWLFWFLSKRVFASTKTNCIIEFCYILPILLLAKYAMYSPLLLIDLSLLAVLAAFVIYLWANLSKNFFTVVLFLAEFACLYYLIGGTVFLFALLVVVCELLVKKRIALAGGFSVLLVIYVIGTRFFEFSKIPSFQWMYVPYVPPFLIILQIAFSKYRHKRTGQRKARFVKNGPVKRSPLRLAGLILRKTIPFALILLTFHVVYKEEVTEVLQVGYYADKEEWQDILDYVERHPESQHNKFCNYDINRALYYTGRLGDKMFSYYQSPPALLLPTSLGSTSGSDSSGSPELMYRYVRKVDLFMELGYLGTAKRYASEGLEVGNGCPHMTKKLALICLAEEQNETAKIYLGALSKDLIYGRFARQLLQRLDRDPQLTDYEPVQHLRSVAFKRDYIGGYSMEHLFSLLLQRNPHNKMAFEYMMASYLLTGQIDKIAENIPRLHEFGYKKLPRHYQEALLIYADSQQRRFGELNLEGLSTSLETTQCYQKFNKVALPLYMRKYDRQKTRQYLAKDFGGTYMFYMCEELPRFRNSIVQGTVNE